MAHTRRSNPARTVAIVCALALAAPAAFASDASTADGQAAPPSPPRWIADVNFGYFTGDYGSDERTDVEIVSPRLRWRFPRGEVRASFPFLRVNTVGNVTFVGGTPVASSRTSGDGDPQAATVETVSYDDTVEGPGDVRLHGEMDLMRGTSTRPWLTGIVKVKVPTADEDEFLGTGEADVEGGLAMVQTFGRTSLLADAKYMVVGDPDGYTLNDVATLGAGVAHKVGVERSSYLYAYLENRTHPTPGRGDRLDVSLGGSRRFGDGNRVRLAGAAYVGLTEAAEDFGVSMTLGHAF